MSWWNAIGLRENAKIMRDLVAVVLAEYEGCTNNVWIMDYQNYGTFKTGEYILDKTKVVFELP